LIRFALLANDHAFDGARGYAGTSNADHGGMNGSDRGSIARLLWESARSRAAATALVERGRETPYHQLMSRAAAIATALTAMGLHPDDRVAIWLDSGLDAVAAFFAVAAVGGIAVVLGETLRARQITHVLTDCGASVLLTSALFAGAQPSLDPGATRLVLVEDIPAAGDFAPVARQSTDPVQIVYTSGSTGRPKGVTVSHGNLWASTRAVTAYLSISPNDRIAAFLPFSFVYGMSQVLCAIGTGATLVIERSPLAAQLVTELRAQRVTVLAGVPPLWLQFLSVPGFRDERLPDLRVMTNAGGHLPVVAVRGLRAAQPQAQLFLMYGLTEALRCTYLPSGEVDRRPNSIGRAIPGGEVLVLRDDLTPCAVGEVGELVFNGPTVTLGYWNDPETTAQVFRRHPQRDAERVVFTGDLVRSDADGFLTYVTRRDRLIKTMGYRVSPLEVSDVILASGEVTDCVVSAEPDELRGQRIIAHVVLAQGGAMERLRLHCGLELPRYMQPVRFEVRTSLPRLPNGKYDVAAVGLAPQS